VLALAAAIVFALALLLDWLDVHVGDAFTWQTLVTVAWLLLALHFWFVDGRATRWYVRSRG